MDKPKRPYIRPYINCPLDKAVLARAKAFAASRGLKMHFINSTAVSEYLDRIGAPKLEQPATTNS
jgi:hypothetical protein